MADVSLKTPNMDVMGELEEKSGFDQSQWDSSPGDHEYIYKTCTG